MTTREVIFDSIDDVRSFVHQAEQHRESVEVRCGSCIVDGKSLLGILSLGIGRKLNLVIHD